MQKNHRLAALTSGVLLVLAGSAGPAYAAMDREHAKLAHLASQLSGSFDTLEIEVDQRMALVAQYAQGIPFESETGAAPVERVTTIENGYEITTNTFSDGSKSVLGIELGVEASPSELEAMILEAEPFMDPDYDGDSIIVRPSIMPMNTGISGCTTGTSAGISYWNNCHIYYHGITASNSFDANYQRGANHASAQYIAGTAKFVSFTMTVSNENVNVYNGNRIRYSFNTSLNGIGNIPGYLQLTVSPTSATVQRG